MRDIELAIAGGRGPEAASTLRQHLRDHPDATHALHQRYRRLLEQIGDVAGLAVHTQVFVPRLLAENRERDALQVLRGMLQRDAMFRVENADQRVQLVRAAMAAGLPDAAMAQAADFHLSHPRHAAVPELALLGARLLIDRDSNTHAARELLHFAGENFPDDPRQQEILLKLEQIGVLEETLSPPGAPGR